MPCVERDAFLFLAVASKSPTPGTMTSSFNREYSEMLSTSVSL